MLYAEIKSDEWRILCTISREKQENDIRQEQLTDTKPGSSYKTLRSTNIAKSSRHLVLTYFEVTLACFRLPRARECRRQSPYVMT